MSACKGKVCAYKDVDKQPVKKKPRFESAIREEERNEAKLKDAEAAKGEAAKNTASTAKAVEKEQKAAAKAKVEMAKVAAPYNEAVSMIRAAYKLLGSVPPPNTLGGVSTYDPMAQQRYFKNVVIPKAKEQMYLAGQTAQTMGDDAISQLCHSWAVFKIHAQIEMDQLSLPPHTLEKNRLLARDKQLYAAIVDAQDGCKAYWKYGREGPWKKDSTWDELKDGFLTGLSLPAVLLSKVPILGAIVSATPLADVLNFSQLAGTMRDPNDPNAGNLGI